MSVSIVGLAEMMGKLAALDMRVQVGAVEAVHAATQDAKDVADSLTPVLSGYLLSRNQIRDVVGGGLVLSELYNDAYYAIFVVCGHHTRSGSFVPANDFFTPAMMVGRNSLMLRLMQLSAF